MGKLDGKVAVITGATSGMALAGAKLFVEEGAHVFITGRRKDALDEAVELIGRNVTAVQGDSSDLDDLDRLFETVQQEKGSIDVLWASAGGGAAGKLGEVTEEQFDAAFTLNARGTFFTVQKALFARVWVAELRDRRIRVNVLTPGSVTSPMMESVLTAEMKEQFESLIPRRAMGQPEEIASVALFLASDDSSYVNGMEIVADGGTTVV